MNHFDRFLERELHRMLDPVVAAEPPTRGARLRRPEQGPEVKPAEVDSVPAVEPVPVSIAVQAAPLV